MDAKHFTYTRPSAIEGESADVAKLAKQQLRDLAAVLGQLTQETIVQIRAAGLKDEADALERWKDSGEGRACDDLAWAGKSYIEAAAAV